MNSPGFLPNQVKVGQTGMPLKDFREEHDSLGPVAVPTTAWHGAQTQRAAEHFTIGGGRLPDDFIASIARIKKHAASVNMELGLISADDAAAIGSAAEAVIAGELSDAFILDIFQSGSGTNTHMNVNEVIATRANEMLTGEKHTRSPVHPNDHVNRCQSSNDVFPSAIRITASLRIVSRLLPSLDDLRQSLLWKASEFSSIQKIGRTHLQDAVVMTLGDEFSGYARQAELSIKRLEGIQKRLLELPLGGTAVGNGVNAHADFAPRVIERLAEDTGLAFREAADHFEAQACRDTEVETMGVMKTIAVSLSKIANDIRWLASGPRCGIGEINLPPVVPGSSIMPGKVNPVICEAVIQAAAQVAGNDAAVTHGGAGGYFEINLMQPLIAANLLSSIGYLSESASLLSRRCVQGITANRKTCIGNVEKSLALATGLVPHIGYDRAAGIAHKAYELDISIEEAALREKVMDPEALKKALYGNKSG